MSVEQVVKLDIVPQKNPPHVRVTEYDKGVNGWVITAYLYKDGEPWEPPGSAVASVEGTKANGAGFKAEGHIMHWDTPCVMFTLTESMTDVSGAAWAKIVFTINDSKIATCGLWLDIERAGVEAGTIIGGSGFEEQLQTAFTEYLEEHGTAPIGSGVNSVNGKSGVVNLKTSDLENDTNYLSKDDFRKFQNLFKPTYYSGYESGIEITFDDNEKTYHIDGTAAETVYPEIGRVTLPAGNYRMLGLCAYGSATTFRVNLYRVSDSNVVAQDRGQGADFTVDAETEFRMVLYISSGTSANFDFKPMITEDLSATIDDFVPFTGGNDNIYQSLADMKHQLFESMMTGDKTHNNDVGWIAGVANSWIRNKSVLMYPTDSTVHVYNLFASNPQKIDGKWPLNCSSFALAVAFGITFENSKYNGQTDNLQILQGYHDQTLMSLLGGEEYFITEDIFEYFVGKGYVFKPDTNFNNLETGDILFMKISATGSYRHGVSHTAVFAYRTSTYIYVWEDGGAAGPLIAGYPYTDGHICPALYAARLPYPSQQTDVRRTTLNATGPVSLASLFNFQKEGKPNMWRVSLLAVSYEHGADYSTVYLIRTGENGEIKNASAVYTGSASESRKLDANYNIYDPAGAYTAAITILVEWLGS